MDEKKAVDSGALEYFHDKLKGEFSTPAQAKDIAKESVYFVPASSANALAGSVSLTLPVPAIQGMSVRFQSPCNSADVEAGIVIDGMSYQWRSVANDDITSLPDLFAVNSVIDIVLDRDNLIALFYRGFAGPAGDIVPERIASGEPHTGPRIFPSTCRL